jgi:hypothetical protein
MRIFDNKENVENKILYLGSFLARCLKAMRLLCHSSLHNRSINDGLLLKSEIIFVVPRTCNWHATQFLHTLLVALQGQFILRKLAGLACSSHSRKNLFLHTQHTVRAKTREVSMPFTCSRPDCSTINTK